MKVNYTEVSEYLKLERFKKKVSQDKIAEFIGISGNTYRSYENNPETITLDVGVKISEFLDCNIFQFFLDSMLQNATKEKQE
ncbi:MAG: helix-turn-helix transcriptional regulator [Firmicutes bacterium]|nr:helix-turn-helix transcriptional regulator [Bacillota bacterium]